MRLTTKIIINNQRILRKSYEELAEVDVTTLNDHDLEEYRKVADDIRRYRVILESHPSSASYEEEMETLKKIDAFKALAQDS